MSAVFLVYSEATGEYALPERMGWTRDRAKAGRFTEARADKAAEAMLDGRRNCISLVSANAAETSALRAKAVGEAK